MLTVDTARFRSSLVCASDRIDGLKYSLRTNTVQLLNRFISLTWRHILILLGCSTVLDNLDNLRLRCSLRAFVFRLFTHSQWWRLDHIFQRAAVDNQRRPRGGSNKNIKKKGGGEDGSTIPLKLKHVGQRRASELGRLKKRWPR